jgi:acyl dehydratase
MTRWYEDITIDEVYPLGSHRFTEAEILDYARSYDPLPIHTAGPDIVASGWHVASICHKRMVDTLTSEAERQRAQGRKPGVSGPSPGVNHMDFLAPVRPGDEIAFTLAVTSKRASGSLPGWGLLFNRLEGHNQAGVLVYSAEVVAFTKMRDVSLPLRMRLALALTRVPGLRKILPNARR